MKELPPKEIINKFSESQLSDIFYYYGEEKNSRKIAKSIVSERKKKEIRTTLELSKLIKKINFYNQQKSVNEGISSFKNICE